MVAGIRIRMRMRCESVAQERCEIVFSGTLMGILGYFIARSY